MLFRDDLLRAIKKLKVLGNGFGIIPVGGTYLVQSVPAELNMDHTVVLQLAEVLIQAILKYDHSEGVLLLPWQGKHGVESANSSTDTNLELVLWLDQTCGQNCPCAAMDLIISTQYFSLSFQKKGYVTVSEIRSSLKWEMERAKQILVRMKVSCAQWSSVMGVEWLFLQHSCIHYGEVVLP